MPWMTPATCARAGIADSNTAASKSASRHARRETGTLGNISAFSLPSTVLKMNWKQDRDEHVPLVIGATERQGRPARPNMRSPHEFVKRRLRCFAASTNREIGDLSAESMRSRT
jgi:hypothetical protein